MRSRRAASLHQRRRRLSRLEPPNVCGYRRLWLLPADLRPREVVVADPPRRRPRNRLRGSAHGFIVAPDLRQDLGLEDRRRLEVGDAASA